MAIQLFCGRPGSGKSYGVVENVILPAIKLARPIYTNIPLNLTAIESDYPGSVANIVQYQNDEVNGEFLMNIPGGALVIIDECWRYWPGGMKANEIPQQDKEFFAEHRHKAGEGGLTQEIVLLTQTPAQIAKVVRDLIDQTVLTVKNNAAGSDKTFNVRIFPGCIPSLEKPGEEMTSGLGRYKPEIYKYYKSHTKSENGLPGVEIRADTRGSVWNHWYIRYVAPIVIVASIWGAWFVYHFFTGDAFDKTKKETVSQSIPVNPESKPQSVPQSSQQQPLAPVAKPVESKRYRIVGSSYREGFLYVYIEDGQTKKFVTYAANDCKIGGLNGPECTIEGQLVTQYTGVHEKKGGNRQNLMDVVPEVSSDS